ncbi:hypothetical protein GCM10010238_59080 [Streptomyces griseoviridis]|uniref:Uncharacterized protein n=1 Tax=Streptomyces griseoviridis TaxID=45398 RepID=A0A918GU41_STRGD|nr:hypothetical protein GCM10010238_59080 [Streptomyces niveoruber]
MACTARVVASTASRDGGPKRAKSRYPAGVSKCAAYDVSTGLSFGLYGMRRERIAGRAPRRRAGPPTRRPGAAALPDRGGPV